MKKHKFFTSESVTEGHPDKIADQISDAVLDAIFEKDPNARVACETLVTTGQVHVVGEISTQTYVDIPKIVRQTIREIGYTRAKFGFDADTSVSVALKHMQEDPVPPMEINPNIPKAVNDIILKAMQKEPMARYQTATAMLRDLAQALKNPSA